MLNPKPPQQEQGFTLTEVLVAILITSVFVLTAMQAMVIAAVMRVKAKQLAEATTWIQQDLENGRFQATLANLPYVNDNLSTTSINEEVQACGKDSTSSSSNGYAAALIGKLKALNSAKSITFNNKIFTAIASTSESSNPRQIGESSFWILRNASSISSSPYNVLQLSYLVVRDKNGSPNPIDSVNDKNAVAYTYSEVIPDAAFKCP